MGFCWFLNPKFIDGIMKFIIIIMVMLVVEIETPHEPSLAPETDTNYADNEFQVMTILDSAIFDDSKVRYYIQYAPTDEYPWQPTEMICVNEKRKQP